MNTHISVTPNKILMQNARESLENNLKVDTFISK